jgi:type I restriction-modification system DNA methylase subunit
MSVPNIKTRQRVRDHGEVFTAEREVKAMCDIVGEDIADIEKRILEPAAGNGNFLVEILKRRIDKIAQTPAKNGKQKFLFLVALSNIYTVDILADNVQEARRRE